MKEFFGGRIQLHAGDCREVLRTLTDDSIDSIVTDPPYELGFMNRKWDSTRIANDITLWTEVLRVLKPGGHMAVFGGTRTAHRMVCAIEDAGFEIRDTLAWVYGQGFPKSHDVSKGIDKAAQVEREVIGYTENARPNRVGMETKLSGLQTIGGEITEPQTDAARQWEGWGSALKPAHEPICLARKPLSESTIAANVLRWGTGGINIDGCRVGYENDVPNPATNPLYRAKNGYETKVNTKEGGDRGGSSYSIKPHGGNINPSPLGRWPANVVHDGSPEVLAGFPERHVNTPSSKTSQRQGDHPSGIGLVSGERQINSYENDGSAARFFYCAKADQQSRLGSSHPTIKPLDLIQWLCRLVTPKGGTTLDNFAGSGTTGEAAYREGFSAVLIEREAEYIKDIERRMSLVKSGTTSRKHAGVKARGHEVDNGPLFGGG